jgi:pimeloyl-ACP methyl ester carboxylesterase
MVRGVAAQYQQYPDTIKVISDKEIKFQPEDRDGDFVTVNKKEIMWEGNKVPLYTQVCSDGIDEKNKKTLLLFHGITSKGATWRYIVKKFARMGWRVITPDFPNHGNSGMLKGIRKLSDYTEEVYQMLKDIGVDDCLVTTSSWAGFPGQALARDHPDFVKGLHLSGPIFELSDIPAGQYYHILRPILTALPINIAKILKNIQAHFRSKTKSEKSAYLKSGIYSLPNDILIELIDATHHFKPGIPDTVPYALQFADKDSLSIMDKIKKYYTLSKVNKPGVYIIKDSGHHIQQENPDGYSSALWDLAQKIDYVPKMNGEATSILSYRPESYRKIA